MAYGSLSNSGWRIGPLSGILHIMEFTEVQRQEIAKMAEKYGLSLVVLFGSQATGKTHAKSDIDIGVAKKTRSFFEEMDVPIIEIENELTDLLRRDDIEIVNLSAVSPALMRSVVEDGKPLYEETSGVFSDWKLFAARIWMETGWLRERQRGNLKAWAKTL